MTIRGNIKKQADIVSRGKSKSAFIRRQLKLTAVFCLKLDNSVKNIFPHTYNNILTIFFKPMHKNLILDGRHRYIEFKKFKKNQLINFSYLNSEDIMDCIPTAFDLVKYIILNNLSEMKSFYDQKKNIETMNFEFYGLSLF